MARFWADFSINSARFSQDIGLNVARFRQDIVARFMQDFGKIKTRIYIAKIWLDFIAEFTHKALLAAHRHIAV